MKSRVIAGAALAVAVVAGACGDKVQPAGSTLITDAPPPAPSAPPDDAQPPVFDAGTIDDAPYDVYAKSDADLGACSSCICSTSTSYCFGGGTLRAAMDSGGPVPCTVASGTAPQVGCNNLPAACAAKPSCECVIAALQPLVACYLNCQAGSSWLVYCPN